MVLTDTEARGCGGQFKENMNDVEKAKRAEVAIAPVKIAGDAIFILDVVFKLAREDWCDAVRDDNGGGGLCMGGFSGDNGNGGGIGDGGFHSEGGGGGDEGGGGDGGEGGGATRVTAATTTPATAKTVEKSTPMAARAVTEYSAATTATVTTAEMVAVGAKETEASTAAAARGTASDEVRVRGIQRRGKAHR